MHEHVLDAILQCNSAGVTGSACPSELEHYHSVFKATKFNIATVLLNRWSDSGFQQFLDHGDNLTVIIASAECIFTDILPVFDICLVHSVDYLFT